MGIRFSNHAASSALAAVSVVLILLYLFWRFIRQIKKHEVNSTTGAAAASPSSSSSSFAALPSCTREGPAPWRAGETSRPPLLLFVRVEVPAAAAGVEKADCAVCLAELGDGQAAARLVPGCGHRFHVECIKAWLNSTCPLCRAAVGRGAGGAPHCNDV